MKNLIINTALASSAIWATGALAQESGDEIVVVGTKVDRSLKDEPASVSIETAAEIAREPVSDLYDIILRVPNVTASSGEQGFAIRGIDQRGVAGSGPTLTVYVDDAPLGNQTTFFGPLGSWDLGQVEVYRGPQSTNFGRNSLAGAIYVRTQDPTYEWDLKIRGEAGNLETYQAAVAAGGPIIDDVLAFRVSGDWRNSDGALLNTFLNEPSDASKLRTGRLKFLFEPVEGVKVITTTSYTENFGGEDGIVLPAETSPPFVEAKDTPREVAYDFPGREGTDTLIQTVNAEWRINEQFSIQSITAFQTTDYVRQEDFDATLEPTGVLDRTGTDEAISEEVRLKYNGGRLKGVAGFYFVDSEQTFDDTFSIPASAISTAFPADVIIDRTTARTTGSQNFAGFLDGEVTISDRLDLLFGVRYDRETQNSFQRVEATVTPEFPPLSSLGSVAEEATDANFDAWLPKGGVRYDLTDDVTLAFVAQRAYRAGGSEINFIDGGVNSFDPEFLWNFELSARTSLLDDRLVWNANIYYSDWNDQQVLKQLPPPFQNFFETINAGKSTLYGVETDFSFYVNPQFEIYGGVGFSVAEFDEFGVLSDDGVIVDDFSGNRFSFAPRVSANFGFNYEHRSGAFGGVDFNYQSSSFSDVDNLLANQVEGRALVNARIGYPVHENVKLTAYVRNLLDNDYFDSVFRSEVGGFARFGDPRTWAVRVDVDF